MKQDKATFSHRNAVKAFTDYELDTWSRDSSTEFILGDCLFGAVKLTKNTDPYKNGYSSSGIGLDARSNFSINYE